MMTKFKATLLAAAMWTLLMSSLLAVHPSPALAQGQGNGNQNSLADRVAALEAAVVALQQALSHEISERLAAVAALHQALSQESADRQTADGALQANLNSESAARQSTDTALQSNLNAESAARSSADGALQAAINSEAQAREQKDGETLTAANDHASQLVANEAQARSTADNALMQHLTNEVNRAQTAESGLGNSLGDLSTLVNQSNLRQIGMIQAFGSIVERTPEGWLLCDGRALSTADYPELYAVIGNAWGGNANSFNLPDLRGRFLRGVDGGANRDRDRGNRSPNAPGGFGGDRVGSVQDYATALPRNQFVTGNESNGHNHGYSDAYWSETFRGNAGYPGSPVGEDYDNAPYSVGRTTGGNYQSHTHRIVGGGDSETRPQNAYVNFIIKAR